MARKSAGVHGSYKLPTPVTSPALARLLPIAFSAVAHVAAAGAMLTGSHAREGLQTTQVTEVDIERTVDVVEPPKPVEEPEPAPVAPVPAPAAHVEHHHHHHDYPVAPSHDAVDHDPSLQHHDVGLPAPAAPVLAAEAPAPLPKFTMSNGPSSQTAKVVATTGTGAGTGAAPAAAPEPVYREGEVSSPARLLSSVAASYPAAARAGELEADVAVEILLDTAGNVLEARVVKPAGSGFDESAVAAVRRYRFSPAVREGRPVRVRMRWSVQFRLR